MISGDVKHEMARSLLAPIQRAAEVIVETIRSGRKVLICGNGGSAADAQHFAAEFLNRFQTDRRPLPAIALTTDTSTMTSIGNDVGFDRVFERQVAALGSPGDLLIVITTSDVSLEPHGHSANIARALLAARANHMRCLGLVSMKSKAILGHLDHALVVPHTDTPRIQESHITLIHILCDLVDRSLFPENFPPFLNTGVASG